MIRRPSPAMLVALLALVLAVTSVGWAATKIGTAQLKPGAVTSQKLHREAVTSAKIAQKADGVALAGLSTRGDGTVSTSFNRLAGTKDPAPQVRHASQGVYELIVPGTAPDPPIDLADNPIQVATLIGAQSGEVSVSAPDALRNPTVVHTYDSAGNPADRAFSWVLFERVHTGSDF